MIIPPESFPEQTTPRHRILSWGIARRSSSVWLLLCLILFTADAAQGGAPGVVALPAQDSLARPVASVTNQLVPGQDLVISLVTVGPGDAIWEKFGHNALRIRDSVTGFDAVYHWGLFDPTESDFVPRFLMGRMRYGMGRSSVAGTFEYYAETDRQIWEQTLDLTADQKAELLRLVRENERPENVYYDYNYYLDNCSTRIRDVLDQVTGGSIRAQTFGVTTSGTFRSHTRRLLADAPLPYLGVQLVLGRPADRLITLWEEMFLPVRMKETVATLVITDSSGSPRALVSNMRVVHEARQREAELQEVSPKTIWYLLAGITIATMIVVFGLAATRGSRPAGVATLVVACLWLVIAGLAGTLAMGMWLITDHTFMYRNATVLLMNPLLLLLLFFAPGAILAAKRLTLVARLSGLVAAISAAALLLHLIPGAGQHNAEMLALAVPPNIALFILFSRILRTGNAEGDLAAKEQVASRQERAQA